MGGHSFTAGDCAAPYNEYELAGDAIAQPAYQTDLATI
jgi:hypothetical protein